MYTSLQWFWWLQTSIRYWLTMLGHYQGRYLTTKSHSLRLWKMGSKSDIQYPTFCRRTQINKKFWPKNAFWKYGECCDFNSPKISCSTLQWQLIHILGLVLNKFFQNPVPLRYLTIMGWLACGVGKASSSSVSVSGGGGRGGARSRGIGGRGGARSEAKTIAFDNQMS